MDSDSDRDPVTNVYSNRLAYCDTISNADANTDLY